MNSRPLSSLLKTFLALLKLSAAATGAALGACALTNFLIAARTPSLGFRLGGEFGRYPARYGDIAYTVAGSGPPLLLLHGLDMGRSMAEWRAVFDLLADHHTVYAFDWLGWGLSDAAREGYNATDFAEQTAAFIDDIIGAPTTVVAAGQSGIFAILAARAGAKISGLCLICPVPPAKDAPSGESRAEALLQSAFSSSLLATPIIGTGALNWLASHRNLDAEARHHGFYDKEMAQSEAKLWHVAAHQSGAKRGQRNLFQGAFGGDWRTAWSEIEVPSLLIWGRNALREGYAAAPEWLALRPDADLKVVEEAMLFPHLEQPQGCVGRLLSWLATRGEVENAASKV